MRYGVCSDIDLVKVRMRLNAKLARTVRAFKQGKMSESDLNKEFNRMLKNKGEKK